METSTRSNGVVRHSLCRVACGALALSISAAPVHAADADIVAPPVPAELQVATGNRPFLVGHAAGTQDYICLPSGSGFAWTFVEPQATLLDDQDEQIITHFLSANPLESGTARATWQHSQDTSTVWGNKIASSSEPDFVAAGAIPWFLLQVVGSQQGPTRGDRLTATTFVQRLNTAGGVAPATGCAQSSDVGNKALVPYTADYFFFSPTASECVGDCNGNGQVTVDEIVTMVKIALSGNDLASCPAGDANHDGEITIDEIMQAVTETFNMC